MGRAVKWTFSARRTRTERQEQRKNIVLRDAGITKKTQERYYHGLHHLLKFIGDVHSTLDLDENICDWIQHCWETGESLHVVSDGLCGLHHFEPWTKRTIPMAWKVFATWRKLESPDRAPPLTRQIIYSWASYAIDHKQLGFASLLCLGFFALLRTGELLKVRPVDLLIKNGTCIVSLYDTKSGQRNNAAEMVMLNDPFTVELLTALLEDRRAQHLHLAPVWLGTAQKFRDEFSRYCKRFDITQLSFRPYSLRRGGATWVFQSSGSMEMALLKGRWSSARVAKIYISDALSFLPGMTFSSQAEYMLRAWDPFK